MTKKNIRIVVIGGSGRTCDARKVITDANARHWGIEVNDQSLVPGQKPRLGSTHFADWLSLTTPPKRVTERQPARALNR